MNVNPLYSTVQYSTVHYITLHYITLHYITLHYTTLHHNTYLLLHYITSQYVECEVRTESYLPSFSLPFMAQVRSVRVMKTRKDKTRIHNLPYGPSKRG